MTQPIQNSQVILKKPWHAEKVIVFCALWSGGFNSEPMDVYRLFLKRNRRLLSGRHMLPTWLSYRTHSDYFWREIEDYYLEDICFQQDWATRHTTMTNRNLLQEKFQGRVILRLSDVNWPARSCDLKVWIFFDFNRYICSLLWCKSYSVGLIHRMQWVRTPVWR